MAEYINKTELISYLEENILWTKRSWEDITSAIDELPTIDIVHCKECKHSKLEDWDGDKFRICTKDNHIREGGWFCADGERSNNG